MKDNTDSVSGYCVKSFLLPISFIVQLVFGMPQVLAQVSFRILDQQGNPVINAVISTPAVIKKVNSIAVMDQINQQFSPKVLVIQKDQFVAFPNSDAIRHHVYSFSAPKPFEIRLFKGQDSPPVKFDQSGIVVLGCNIHDQMLGYIYIAENEITAVTNKEGQATLATSKEGYSIWHPRLSASNTKRLNYTLNGDTQTIQTVNLSLLPEKEKVLKRKFSGRKFGSGGE